MPVGDMLSMLTLTQVIGKQEGMRDCLEGRQDYR
jgi:hypothetical protein